jgi:putative ABC transport system substrate-binding protein
VKRREFITLLGGALAGGRAGSSWRFAPLGGAAAAWPLAARAQQPMPVIGLLRSSTKANTVHLVAALAKGLAEARLIEGKDMAIETRYADNQPDRLPGLVADLARHRAAVIVADNNAALAAKNVTATPIVFASGGDPVRSGLVASLNRPGGHVTGVVFLAGVVSTKRFELLRQLVPKATTIAAFLHTGTPTTDAERRDLQAAAQSTGQQVILFDIASGGDLETAFASFAARGIGAVLVGSGPFLNSHAPAIIASANRHQVPVIYPQREHTAAGGLMSYGTSITDAYREAGIYAARILRGEKPGDLPVLQSSKFEFVINLKTAKALGLEFHPQLLATADEVIE